MYHEITHHSSNVRVQSHSMHTRVLSLLIRIQHCNWRYVIPPSVRLLAACARPLFLGLSGSILAKWRRKRGSSPCTLTTLPPFSSAVCDRKYADVYMTKSDIYASTVNACVVALVVSFRLCYGF